MIKYPFVLLFTLSYFAATANISLPKIFGDHMVLQRNKPIHIWGWASPNETVKVSLGNTLKSTRANAQGKWEIQLPSMKEGGPHQLTVSAQNTINLNDIYIGEVWLCSGQSNMEWPLQQSANAQQEISQANYPLIRHIKVERATDVQPREDIASGKWEVCSPQTAGNFTAVGYFYARELYKELKVPIGLINSSWGGTMVETWISNGTFFSNPEFSHLKNAMPLNLDSSIRAQQLAMENLIRSVQNRLPTPEEEKTFSSPNYNDAAWKTMKLPGAWENNGLPELDGEVWFRTTIELPLSKNEADEPVLSLGPIDDIDSTYVNGVFIGSTRPYNAERKYKLPKDLLKPGKNTIAIKVVDNQGGGGLYGTPEELKLQVGNMVIGLNTEWKFQVARHFVTSAVGPNRYPTLLYNAMIHPIIKYSIAGVIWYQGETNTGRSMQYRTAFPLMIQDWRKQWNDNFPFYFVQLANYHANGQNNSNGGSGWAELREAQAYTLKVPKTGMAVIIDIGESKDIHPRNKQDVGKRLAANALVNTYGKKMEYTGPVFSSMMIVGKEARISFSHSTGLQLKPASDQVTGFEIAGDDQKFYPAKARIEGNKIIVWSDQVQKPASVRYAWADDPQNLNLYNKAGFPAAPFRTDNWKARTEGIKFEFK